MREQSPEVVLVSLANKNHSLAKTIFRLPNFFRKCKKCLNIRQKLGTRNVIQNLKNDLNLSLSYSLTLSVSFLKISPRVWSEGLVNSVKIDGDGEASDLENDVVENDFILSNDKINNSELSAPGLLQRMKLFLDPTGERVN